MVTPTRDSQPASQPASTPPYLQAAARQARGVREHGPLKVAAENKGRGTNKILVVSKQCRQEIRSSNFMIGLK